MMSAKMVPQGSPGMWAVQVMQLLQGSKGSRNETKLSGSGMPSQQGNIFSGQNIKKSFNHRHRKKYLTFCLLIHINEESWGMNSLYSQQRGKCNAAVQTADS